MTIDFNGSMLVKKTITHRKGPSKEMGLDKIVRSRSGLTGMDRRDYGFDKKIFVGIAGLKNPIGDPQKCGCVGVCLYV